MSLPDLTSQRHQRRILIAMDGSLYSRRALEWYAEFLDRIGDFLVFVYVAEPPPVGIGDGLGMIRSAELFRRRLDDMVQRARIHRQMAALLDEKCNQLDIARPYKFVECFSSNIGAAILDTAHQEAVDFVLLGNRGANSMRKSFLGSVSKYVLHHSHQPVIIVPLKPEPRNSLASTVSTWTDVSASSDSNSSSIGTLSPVPEVADAQTADQSSTAVDADEVIPERSAIKQSEHLWQSPW